jgi:hypothetical protein
MEEAIEWVKRCPNPHPDEGGTEIEIRPVFEAEDFGTELAGVDFAAPRSTHK